MGMVIFSVMQMSIENLVVSHKPQPQNGIESLRVAFANTITIYKILLIPEQYAQYPDK